MISFNAIIRGVHDIFRWDTNWFTGAIHLCARKYCTKANWKILQSPNSMHAWFRNKFFKMRISFCIYFFYASAVSPTDARFNLSYRISCQRQLSMVYFPRNFFFFLISCLVSFVPWWNHAFVIHNHSIYLRAEKSGLRTSLYTDIWSVKNVQLIRRREKGRMKIWSSKANRFAVSAKINI